MRVLLVEDDPDHALLVSQCLKGEFGLGLDVETAQSGEEALERIELGPALEEPDMILLDLYLPGISGLEVLSRLRDGDDNRPVVLVTSCNDQQVAMKALRCGANDFVTKSADFPENLVGAVARALEHARLQEELAEAQAHIATLEVPLIAGGQPYPADQPPAGAQVHVRSPSLSDQERRLLAVGKRLEALGSAVVKRLEDDDDLHV